jgi:hypothetical protein
MGKRSTKTSEIRFVETIVLGTEAILLRRVHQLPGFTGIGRCLLTCIPLLHPRRITIIVVAAGDELAGFFGEPEGLAGMASHRYSATIFYRHTEDL